MKIYVTNANSSKLLTTASRLASYKETNDYILLYSSDGIFKINETDSLNRTITKHIYLDGATKTIKLNDYNVICDTSKITDLIDISQIPYAHAKKNVREEKYKLSKRSKLSLILLYMDYEDTVFDYYFEYEDEVAISSISDDNIIFKEDLLTFLS